METVAHTTDQASRPDLLIVTNGYSFSAEEMRPKLTALASPERWGNISHIPTSIDDSYLDELIPQITPGSTIVISGGDDTVRRTLLRLQEKGIAGEENDIVVAGAGGENVVAQTLHGKKHHKDPEAILRGGTKRTIYPTEATMLNKDGVPFRTERFLFSLGMNASAIAMRQYFNKSDWRERQHQRGRVGQWLFKRLCAIDAIMRSPVIETDRGKAVDVTISGGEFSAGRALRYDTSLSNQHENVLSVTKPYTAVASIIGRKSRSGRAPGDTWHGGHGTIRIDSEVEAEIDGNNIEPIPAGTTIRFQRARQGVAVLALR